MTAEDHAIPLPYRARVPRGELDRLTDSTVVGAQAADAAFRQDARALGRERLRIRRERTRRIRIAAVSVAVAVFLAAWLAIFVQLVSGHDPALSAAQASTSSGATSSAATTSSGGASGSTATLSGAGSSSSGPTVSAVTTRQS